MSRIAPIDVTTLAEKWARTALEAREPIASAIRSAIERAILEDRERRGANLPQPADFSEYPAAAVNPKPLPDDLDFGDEPELDRDWSSVEAALKRPRKPRARP